MDSQAQVCGSEKQDLIWDYFQNEGSDSFANSLARLTYLAEHLKRGWRILNIGVGNGVLERLAIAKGCDVWCLDPSSRAIERLRSELRLEHRAQVGYSQALPFKDSEFDAIVMSEVLEHLSDAVLQLTLKECLRTLRDGGLFIGTVPADEKLFESQVVCPECGKIFHRWGHVQEFSEERLKGLLEQHFGNCVVKRKYFGNWGGLNWKGRMFYILKSLNVALGVKGGGETLFFCAKKNA